MNNTFDIILTQSNAKGLHTLKPKIRQLFNHVIGVVVYHVTIAAIGHGLLKKFWLFGDRLRATHCRDFLYMKLGRPAYFVRTTQLLTHPGRE